MAGELGDRGETKVFWFFSSEKNILSFSALGRRIHAAWATDAAPSITPMSGLVQRLRSERQKLA